MRGAQRDGTLSYRSESMIPLGTPSFWCLKPSEPHRAAWWGGTGTRLSVGIMNLLTLGCQESLLLNSQIHGRAYTSIYNGQSVAKRVSLKKKLAILETAGSLWACSKVPAHLLHCFMSKRFHTPVLGHQNHAHIHAASLYCFPSVTEELSPWQPHICLHLVTALQVST